MFKIDRFTKIDRSTKITKATKIINTTRIAICDNSKNDRTNVKKVLKNIEKQWNVKFKISLFSNGDDLCKSINHQEYDIVIMESAMENGDSIETSSIIRSNSKDTLIIIIAQNDDNMKKLINIQTIAFLYKPLDYSEFEDALRYGYFKLKN